MKQSALREEKHLMKTILKPICALVAAASLSGMAAPTDRYATVIDKYSSLLQEEMEKLKVVGLGVALVDERDVLWARTFGQADAAKGLPATTNTLFGIGSMTKVFTATAVMQLHGQGALDIDQPMVKALPGFRIKSRFAGTRPITVRQVLTHHAGIPGDLMGLGENEDFRAFVPALADMHAAFAPEYVDSYSNLGFCLLGSVIEQVSKQPYEDYLRVHLFRPCGMKVTRVNANTPGVANLSLAYDEQRNEKTDDSTPSLPAGSVFSSVDDMTRFLQAWLNHGLGATGVLLESNLVEQMFRVQNREVELDLGHARGLCWDIEDGDAGRLYSHGGALRCFRSQMVIAPEAGLAAIMMANTATGGGLTWRTKELLKEAARIKGVSATQARRATDPTPQPRLVPLPVEKIPGIYAADFVHITVTITNTDLFAEVHGTILKLPPNGDGTFRMQYQEGGVFKDIPGETYLFAEVEGQTLMIQEKWGSKNNAGARITPSPIPAAWRARLGKYQTTRPSKNNWFSEAELLIQDQLLVLKVPLTLIGQTAPFELQVEDDQVARIPGMNRYSGNVLEVGEFDGGRASLRFMGVPLKKL
jgi:CubicO group peptidase (beta-lactamase class C family)